MTKAMITRAVKARCDLLAVLGNVGDIQAQAERARAALSGAGGSKNRDFVAARTDLAEMRKVVNELSANLALAEANVKEPKSVARSPIIVDIWHSNGRWFVSAQDSGWTENRESQDRAFGVARSWGATVAHVGNEEDGSPIEPPRVVEIA